MEWEEARAASWLQMMEAGTFGGMKKMEKERKEKAKVKSSNMKQYVFIYIYHTDWTPVSFQVSQICLVEGLSSLGTPSCLSTVS